MKLICGLGNPGREYENTRHNAGFMIIDNYLQGEKMSLKFNGLYVIKELYQEKVIFLKPQSYMNNSGEVVRPFRDYFKLSNHDILIIRDDLDLPLGKGRVKYDSSSGGNNGIKSIIANLGGQDFYQYKVGISKNSNFDTKDYVLSSFSKEEKNILDELIADSQNVIDSFIKGTLKKTHDYDYGGSK